jgi:hypothetical protein
MEKLRNAHTILVENLKKGENSEDKGIGGRVLLKWFLGKKEGVDCIHLAQYKDWWRGLLNTAMKLVVQ